MDMPKGCRECPCANLADEGWSNFCQVNKAHIFDDYKRTNCCPLREVPQKKEDNSVIHIERYEGYLEGWNDCVKEILGERENEQ